jgi:hypothetical protein
LEAKRRGQHSICWPSALVGPMVSYGQRPDQTAELLILLLLATEDLQHHTWCGTSLDKKAPPLLRDLVADLQRSAVPSALLQEIASRFGGFDWRRMQPAELERCQLAVRHFAMGVCRKVFDSLLEASQPMAGSSAGPDRKVDESTLLLAIRNLGDLQTLLVSLGELGRAVIPALLESLGRAETVAPDLLQRRLLEILFRDRVLEWSRLTRRGGHELFSVWRANLDQAFLAPAELPLLWSGAVDWVLAQPEEEIASCASQALSWLGDFRLPLVEDRQGVRLMIDAMERLMPPVVEMARRLVDTIARERLVASLSSGLLALPLGLLDRQYGEQIAAEICGYCRRVLEMGLPRADLPVQDLQATVTLLEARLGVLTMDAPDDPRSYLRLWGWEEPGDEAEKGSSAVMQLSLLQQACLDYAHDPHPRSRALLVAIFARALVVSVGSSIRFGDPMGLLPRDSGSRFGLLADALSLLNSRQSLVGVWKAIHPRAKHFLTTIDRVPLQQLQELATRILKECGGEPWTLARSLLLSLFSPLQGGSDGVIQVAGSHAKVFLTAELVRSLEDEALNRSLAQWLSQPIPLGHSKIASWMALIVIAARRKQKERE